MEFIRFNLVGYSFLVPSELQPTLGSRLTEEGPTDILLSFMVFDFKVLHDAE